MNEIYKGLLIFLLASFIFVVIVCTAIELTGLVFKILREKTYPMEKEYKKEILELKHLISKKSELIKELEKENTNLIDELFVSEENFSEAINRYNELKKYLSNDEK
jgi:hypothetical protein